MINEEDGALKCKIKKMFKELRDFLMKYICKNHGTMVFLLFGNHIPCYDSISEENNSLNSLVSYVKSRKRDCSGDSKKEDGEQGIE